MLIQKLIEVGHLVLSSTKNICDNFLNFFFVLKQTYNRIRNQKFDKIYFNFGPISFSSNIACLSSNILPLNFDESLLKCLIVIFNKNQIQILNWSAFANRKKPLKSFKKYWWLRMMIFLLEGLSDDILLFFRLSWSFARGQTQSSTRTYRGTWHETTT